ncbi:U3 small nucleolar RNA-associated protein 21 homolog [Henckelia pumila]|uniref:U3 small nucleolar RNA-associated protein 21 homolog n=1 Tax=Henckelia pumila TaxID=405737 RepID=UPI003C6E97ED
MGIFEPFRSIGYITTGVPFSVQRLGTETFVTVSVGKAFQIYNCAKLTLVLVGPQLPKKIRALASHRDYTFAAYGSKIAVFKRAHQVAIWGSHGAKINHFLLFGEHILSLDVKGNLFMWPFKEITDDISPVGHISLGTKFSVSCIMHPDTYLNKVIFGSQEGPLQLWNISTKNKLHEFKGWNAAICCCVSSPALHVIAVGCSDGKIHVHNILYDEEVVTFTHSTSGAVTALSFSTDGQPLLAAGGSSGVVSIWNLEKRKLHSVIREAHDSSIVSLHFFACEPVLMSSSADNSVKMWIFDTSDGDPRLLRFRSGHSAPPLCIKFYANGRHILSGGHDCAFRLFSVVQDQQSRELSQRHASKRAKRLKLKETEIKLKPVITFDVAEIRERDWCNVVTCHMDTAQAYVWRLQNFVIGEHILSPSTQDTMPVKACAISACGNFAVIGTAGGWIERFNLQSGISRGNYVDMTERKTSAHAGEVVGIACDSTNTIMISAGYHGDVKVWDFKGRDLRSRWEIGCSLVKIVYHRYNGLLATVADDLVIRLFDVISLRMVRKFEGHADRITDMCFSEDGKWLLTSSMDGTLRIWDVILAKQIDAVHVDIPVTALSLSPNMDILATAHVDQTGIYLWVNYSMFSASNKADSYGSGKEIVSIKLPSVSSLGDTSHDYDDFTKVNISLQEAKDPSHFQVLDYQISDLVTLSLLPKSRWQSLINLDIIKARNKPIEPPKKPEKAPFFLPTTPILSGEIFFKARESAEEEKLLQTGETVSSKEAKTDVSESHFLQALQTLSEEKNFAAFTDYIKGLSSSTLDMELRMLQIIDDNDEPQTSNRSKMYSIELLLDYFIQELLCRKNFEFIQAVLRLFLKIHGESIRQWPALHDKAQKLLEIQSTVWPKIENLFQSTRCMVTFLSNSFV